MAIRLGMDAKLYFKTGGISGAGTWTELGNAKDVTLNLERVPGMGQFRQPQPGLVTWIVVVAAVGHDMQDAPAHARSSHATGLPCNQLR